jgi:hypothetical protein
VRLPDSGAIDFLVLIVWRYDCIAARRPLLPEEVLSALPRSVASGSVASGSGAMGSMARAGGAKAAGAAFRTDGELLNHHETGPDDRHEHHLREAFPGHQHDRVRPGGVAVPGTDQDRAGVIKIYDLNIGEARAKSTRWLGSPTR